MPSKPIWYPSPNLIAQLAHFGWGMLIVVLFYMFGGLFGLYLGMVGVFLYASIKEFVFDKYVEGQDLGDNAYDWMFWMLAMVAGVLTCVAHMMLLNSDLLPGWR